MGADAIDKRGYVPGDDDRRMHWPVYARFERLLVLAVVIGVSTGAVGAYASYFLDGATGGIIVALQTLIFLAAFVVAPKHGLLAARRRAIAALAGGAGALPEARP